MLIARKEEITQTVGKKQFNYQIHFHEQTAEKYEFDVKEEITQPVGGKRDDK